MKTRYKQTASAQMGRRRVKFTLLHNPWDLLLLQSTSTIMAQSWHPSWHLLSVMLAFIVPSLMACTIPVSNRMDCNGDSRKEDSPCLARQWANNRDGSSEEVDPARTHDPLLLAALREKTLDVLAE